MIFIPKICGICNSNVKSLNMIYEVYEKELCKENPKKIYIYKKILNNQKVINEFNDLGIETIDSLDNITSNDIVIIRTYGESLETINYLKTNNIEYYDTTCPLLSKLQKNILEKYNKNYEIIIIGKNSNPEITTINNWCNNKAIIIENKQDLKKIPENKNKKYIICHNNDKFTEIIDYIKEYFKDTEIILENSVCKVLKNTIKSSIEIAKKIDLMIVVGENSNDLELYNEINKYTKTEFFCNIVDFYKYILKENINSEMNIGITAGLSIPIKEIYNYKYLLTFLLFYKDRLKELKENQSIINNRLKNDTYNENITSVIDDFIDLNQNGKYIRGILIALGSYLASGEKNKEYLNLAYAYEMLQTSILIHDDIIDNAKIRRGKETIPRRICQKYLNESSNKEYHRHVLAVANSLGICAGDFGFYEAYNLIVKNYSNHKNFAKILEFYNNIVIKTIKGEILDVILPFKEKYNLISVEEKDILDIYHLKTSWYTIIGPFFLGYILGGKNEDEDLKRILNKIGIAFQIKDDILGIFGSNKEIGKSNISDIEEFKQTIMYSYITKTEYKNEFLKIYGKKNINEIELKKIRNLLIVSESYDYTKNYLDNIFGEIINEIEEYNLIEEGNDILKGLLIFINVREK